MIKNNEYTNQVFIILVNYNTIQHTCECIESIMKSTYKHISIIVVDNNSQDECKKIIEKNFKDVIVIENSKNYGFAAANNIGISCARKNNAAFIMLLNNDTVLDPNCIYELFKTVEKRKTLGENCCIVTSKILNYYHRDMIWYAAGDLNNLKGDAVSHGFGEEDEGKYDKELICTFASGCCLFGTLDVFEKVSLSENYFLYYEDVDFCQKLKKLTIPIIYQPRAIVYHKESVSTKKKSRLYSYYFSRNRLMYISKNIVGINKIVSYIYTFMWLVKKVILRELIFKSVLVGVLDFWKGYCADEHSEF